MNRSTINLLLLSVLAISINGAFLGASALAQNGNVKTSSKMLYHNGPVLTGNSNVYLIWYGNWASSAPGNNSGTQAIVSDLIAGLGGTPYFQINTTYPDFRGMSPRGSLFYAGSATDLYSHGLSLTESDIQGIIADALNANRLPFDNVGIYIVI